VTPGDDMLSLIRAVRARIESERLAGLTSLPLSARPGALAAASPIVVPTPAPASDGRGSVPPAWPGKGIRPSQDPARMPQPLSARAGRKLAALKALEAEIGDCCRCKLGHGRRCLVFGVGNPDADLLFVGEGPGYEEDEQGEPFVGRAGQMLTDIIQNVLKLTRRDVYIANVVKCRPPNNRTPQPDEVAACSPFLMRQIETIRPRVIVALGGAAAHCLLRTTTGITALRGNVVQDYGAAVMPTFHPAYLLRLGGERQTAEKRKVLHDMLAVKRLLDGAGPKPDAG
jgi:DNA polymerase